MSCQTLYKQRKRSTGPSELLVAPFPKSEVAALRAVLLPLKDKPELNTDLKYAEGKQRDCRKCLEERRRTKEKKKKTPEVWHLNFQSLFSLFQTQPKRSNLQAVCRVTQPKALL